jgi:Zn-finger nucleic acid-binding protein
MVLYRERGYHHCEHCDSYHFPDPDHEGLRILGENQDGLKCTHCHVSLNMMIADDFYRGYRCPNCRGMLFNRSSFRDVIDRRRANTKAPPEPVNTFNPAELDRRTDCPICKGKMDTFLYNGPGNIVIDTCHNDDLIWLDYGELNKVVNAPGRDRGVPIKKALGDDQDDKKKKPEKGNRSVLDQFLTEVLDSFFPD